MTRLARRRSTKLYLPGWQLAVTASLLTTVALPARAKQQIAYSQKLGIEITVDGADWCSSSPALRVSVHDQQAFNQPDLLVLLQRVGTQVVAVQCPAALAVQFTGIVAGSPATVWRGTGVKNGNWAVAANLDPPSAPAVPAAPSSPPTSTLVGDWVGNTVCGQRPAPVTVSLYEVVGTEAHAFVEQGSDPYQRPGGWLRYISNGNFDARSG